MILFGATFQKLTFIAKVYANYLNSIDSATANRVNKNPKNKKKQKNDNNKMMNTCGRRKRLRSETN